MGFHISVMCCFKIYVLRIEDKTFRNLLVVYYTDGIRFIIIFYLEHF